jgi:hypothetical protein
LRVDGTRARRALEEIAKMIFEGLEEIHVYGYAGVLQR